MVDASNDVSWVGTEALAHSGLESRQALRDRLYDKIAARKDIWSPDRGEGVGRFSAFRTKV